MSAADPLAMMTAIASALERVAVDPALGDASADVLKIVAAWIRDFQPAAVPNPSQPPVDIGQDKMHATVLAVHWPLIEALLEDCPKWFKPGGKIELPNEVNPGRETSAYLQGLRDARDTLASELRKLPRLPVRG